MEIRVTERDRLAPKPKKRNTPIIISTAMVCSIAAIVGWKLYQGEQENKRKLESHERHNAELQRQEDEWRAEMEARKPKPERTPHYYEINKDEPKATTAPGERQTVFTDRNYTPKGAVNSVAAPAQRHFEVKPATRRQQTVEQRVAPWRWESFGSGGRKQVESGNFTYMAQGGRVDTGSVCKNEKYGSFRYRDCRKGAKAYFVQACKTGNKEACTAASMAP